MDKRITIFCPPKKNENGLYEWEGFCIETCRIFLVPIAEIHAQEFKNNVDKNSLELISTLVFNNINDVDKIIEESYNLVNNGNDIIFSIINKATSSFMGNIGLHDINTRTPMFFIWLYENMRGRGFGKEGLNGLLKFVKSYLDYDYIIYPVEEDNIFARSLIEELGGVKDGVMHFTNIDGIKLEFLEYRIYK